MISGKAALTRLRGVAVLDDGQENRALAFGTHDILLHRPAVADMRDIGEVDSRAADLLDRQAVQVGDRRRKAVDLHDELLVAHLRIAGGQGQALRIDGVDDVVRGYATGAQGVRVEIDHHLAIFSAIGSRQCDAGNRRQRLPDLIDAVVVKLLFVQPVGAQTQLEHRD